jgi:hypothetical protein
MARFLMLGGRLLSPVVVVSALLLGVAGGWIGWRRSTRRLHRRSLRGPDLPPDMTRREFDRQFRSRMKRLRLVWTAVYFLGGALLGAALTFFLVLQRR